MGLGSVCAIIVFGILARDLLLTRGMHLKRVNSSLSIQIRKSARQLSVFFCYLFYTMNFLMTPSALAVTVGDCIAELTQGLPENTEPYSVRPDILSEAIEPKALDPKLKIAPTYFAFRERSLIFLAEIFAFYPNERKIFLARDQEYFFDIAQLLTYNTARAKQIMMLNISDNTKYNPNVKAYYEQNEVDSNLIESEGIVFVDTGYRASIRHSATTIFSDADPRRILAHNIITKKQMGSARRAAAMSLAYLSLANSTEVDYQLIDTLDGVSELEDLPHYTEKSHLLVNLDGQILPLSNKPYSTNDRQLALAIMQDLKLEFTKPQKVLKFWNLVEDITHLIQQDEQSTNSSLKLGPLAKYILMDFSEVQRMRATGFADVEP